jgi:putative PEP-CTERM system TPR-repeat lipoprotein
MNFQFCGVIVPILPRHSKRQAHRTPVWPGLALALALGLAACDDGSGVGAGAYVERAAAYFEKSDYRASVIELKNALQLDPRDAEARLLLGRTYLELGDSASAEKELRRARALGKTGAEFDDALGRSLLNQARYGDVLAEFRIRPDDPAVIRATVYTLRGHALRALGQYTAAARQFSRALEVDTEHAGALAGAARIAIRRQALDEAQLLFARAARIAPTNPDVLSLGGDLDLLDGRYAEAETTFQSLAEARPAYLEYRLPLAFARIAHGNLEQAVADLAPVLRAAPDHIGANYLRALAAFSARDYEVAKSYSDKVLAKNVEYVPAKLLAGAASFALDQNEQAFRLLAGYLGDVPSDTAARQLLGATILRIGQPEVSVAQLNPILDPSLDDAHLMSQVASAALRSGYQTDALTGFHRVALNESDSSEVLTDLGTLSLDEGNTAKAIEEFEKALEKNPDYDRALVGVVLARLKAGQLDEALTAAERFRDAYPERSPPSPARSRSNRARRTPVPTWLHWRCSAARSAARGPCFTTCFGRIQAICQP